MTVDCFMYHFKFLLFILYLFFLGFLNSTLSVFRACHNIIYIFIFDRCWVLYCNNRQKKCIEQCNCFLFKMYGMPFSSVVLGFSCRCVYYISLFSIAIYSIVNCIAAFFSIALFFGLFVYEPLKFYFFEKGKIFEMKKESLLMCDFFYFVFFSYSIYFWIVATRE